MSLKRSGLKPATPEQVQAWQAKPRKPLARATKAISKRGRKAKREAPALRAFTEALKRRSGGRCEAFWIRDPVTQLPVCGTHRPHPGTDPHHVWPEDRDSGRHDPNRGLWLCRQAHTGWTHEHPERAAEVGLLRPTGDK